MSTRSSISLANVAASVGSVLLLGIGLVLAALSNPRNFSESPANDRTIDLLMISGFGLTLTGLFLFLMAARHTTKVMPERLRSNANAGVGLAVLLQIAGFVLPEMEVLTPLGGAFLIVISIPFFLWGTFHYARGKGYTHWVGLLGLLGVIGLLLLVTLPTRREP